MQPRIRGPTRHYRRLTINPPLRLIARVGCQKSAVLAGREIPSRVTAWHGGNGWMWVTVIKVT
jgi:hypothetical protein